jgi:hypothetical protein
MMASGTSAVRFCSDILLSVESFSPQNEGITKRQNPCRLKAIEICNEASYRQLFFFQLRIAVGADGIA